MVAGQALRCHPVYTSEYTSITAIYMDCGETYREEGRPVEGSLQRFGIKLRRLTVRRTPFTVLLEEKAGCCSLHPAYMYVLCQRAFCICAVATSGGSPRFFLFLLFLLFYLSEPLQLSVSFPFHSSLLCLPLTLRPAPRRCLHFLTFLKPVSHLVVTESLNSKRKKKWKEERRERKKNDANSVGEKVLVDRIDFSYEKFVSA